MHLIDSKELPVVTTSPNRGRTRRLAIAGLLGAAVLTGGAGAAHAASTDSRAVETGYAVVVDGRGASAETANDCPEDAAEGTDVSVLVEAGEAK
jgi:hypothetical protein